jgi:hypothetical protein
VTIPVRLCRDNEKAFSEPFSAATDEVGAKPSSNDTALNSSISADPVKNVGANVHWTPEEDVKLNSAVMNTCKKKHGKEYRIDWAAVATLVPGRVETQVSEQMEQMEGCLLESHHRPDEQTYGYIWTEDEDSKLKDAVQMHGGKNWGAVAALVLGRTRNQCCKRWHDFLRPNIGRANRRTGT